MRTKNSLAMSSDPFHGLYSIMKRLDNACINPGYKAMLKDYESTSYFFIRLSCSYKSVWKALEQKVD